MSEDDDRIRPPRPPRLKEHLGLIRWSRNADGEWTSETATGRFADDDSLRWVVTLYTGIELEYDLDTWSPYKSDL